jgi:outer membrane usher protein FimD/PapC
LLCGTSLVCAPAAARAQDNQPVVLEAPLLLDGAYLGDVTVEVILGGPVRADSERLRDLLDDRLAADALAALGLEAGGSSGELVGLSELRARGLDIDFDMAALAVEVRASPADRLRRSLPVRGAPDMDPDSAEPPALNAGGVSLTLRPEYLHTSTFEDSGWRPFEADFRGFFAHGGFEGWAVSFAGRYDEDDAAEEAVQLTDLTWIKDDFDRAIRYSAGSFRPRPLSRFSLSADVVGLSMERDYRTIRPFRNLRPSGATSFTLEREALVTILVNGQMVSTQRLGPGALDLTDFPFATGANDVRVLIEDGFGQREIAGFTTYLDSSLLGAGETLFGLSAGLVPNDLSGSVLDLSGDTALQAYVERGFSDTWTGLFSLRTLNEQVELLTAQRLALPRAAGVIAAEIALTGAPGERVAAAAAVSYAWRSSPAGDADYAVNLQQIYEDDRFGLRSIGFAQPGGGDLWETSLRVSRTQGRVTLGASASRRSLSGEDASEIFGLDASYSRWGVSFSARVDQVDGPDEDETRVFFGVSRSFGESRVRARWSSPDSLREASWSRVSGQRVGDWGAQAVLSEDSAGTRLDATVSAIAPRAELELSHRADRSEGDDQVSTRAALGIGFGFADGQAAFGRPFGDAFIIASAHPSLDGRQVSLRGPGLGDGVDAANGRLGPAFYPVPDAYRPQQIEVDVEDLPPGYAMSPEITAFPGARAGYAVTVGSQANVTLMGTLLLPDGQAAARRVGRLIPEADGNPVRFFTNAVGRLVAEGLSPGRYRLELIGDPPGVATIIIPEDAAGLMQLGHILIGGDRA